MQPEGPWQRWWLFIHNRCSRPALLVSVIVAPPITSKERQRKKITKKETICSPSSPSLPAPSGPTPPSLNHLATSRSAPPSPSPVSPPAYRLMSTGPLAPGRATSTILRCRMDVRGGKTGSPHHDTHKRRKLRVQKKYMWRGWLLAARDAIA